MRFRVGAVQWQNMNDLRLAFRLLAKSPGFTLVALLTLALGIGFSTGSFSVANAFLLRTLPYPENERLLRIHRTSRQSSAVALPPADAIVVRETAQTLSATATFSHRRFALGEPGQPAEQIAGMAVTTPFLDVLQVKPALGRGFLAGEDQPGQATVALITQQAWTQRYGRNAGVIGRTVRLDGQTFTIIGVLPPDFDAPLVWGPLEFIVPHVQEPGFRTDHRGSLGQIGRLKAGVSLKQAQAEITAIGGRLAREFPKDNGGYGLRATTLFDSNMDDVSRGLMWLMTALALTMLLIACANLASLQLARAFARSREYAIRAALGGGRRQLMMPLLIESLVLAAAGGALGLLVASWSNDIIGRLLIINDRSGFALPIDARVFAFAAATSLLSGLAFGLVPAWLAGRAPAADALREGARAATSGTAQQRLKRVLIVAETSLALVLVGAAASFGVGTKLFFHRDVGWKIDGLFSGSISLPRIRYPDETSRRDFQSTLLERIQHLPGVQHAALASNLPVFRVGRPRAIVVEGAPTPEAGREPTAEPAVVSPEYFTTLGLTFREGAAFLPTLESDDPPVVIVNDVLARRFWPGESALGRRIRFANTETWMQVVGVVSSVRAPVPTDAPETWFQLYRPLVQAPPENFTIALRTAMTPDAISPAVRNLVAAVDADLAVVQPGSLRAQLDRNLSNVNLVIANLAISAAMGLLIASVGLFGVISQLALQRTRDIGVRMALGAQYQDILRLVLGEGVRLLAIGVLLGIPGCFALNMFLRGLMPEMQLPGLWLLATNVVVLSSTMLLATWLPARRAATINPVEALRAE